jgi:hypothetical protein
MTLLRMNPQVSKAYGCADARKRLWEYLDQELPNTEAEGVGRHVARCPVCGPLAALARRLLERIAKISPAHNDLTALRLRIIGTLRRRSRAHI